MTVTNIHPVDSRKDLLC